MTVILVCVASFLAFVWLVRRLKALDDRDGPRPGWPADAQRKDWQ